MKKHVRLMSLGIPVLAVVLILALVLTGRLGGSGHLQTAEAINLASAPGTFSGKISVQNPNSDSAFVVVGFYDGAGTRVKDVSNTVGGGQNWEIDLSTVDGLPSGRYSAVVESDKPVKAVTALNSTGPITSDSYSATADTDAGTTVYGPAILRNYAGFSTSITVQNANASGDVNVTVQYRSSGGSVVTTDTTNGLHAGAAVTYDQGTDGRLGNGFVGDAIISATGKIAVVVSVYNPSGTGMFATYNATGASSPVYLPVTLRMSDGMYTVVIVQNTQTDRAVNASISYGGGAPVSKSIPAGGNAFWFTNSNADAPLPSEWAGPAKVTADGSVSVVVGALREQPGGGTRFTAYSGFADGATQVSLPNLSRSAGGISSILLAQNIGNAAADITFRFSNGTVRTFSNVPANGLAIWPLAAEGALGAPWTGNATVSSSQKVIAIAANDNDTSPTTGDWLRVFKGLQ